MSLTFEQRGQTWLCRESDPAWPITLVARHVYYGTARLPATLTLAKGAGKAAVTILTSHIDLLIAAQRKSFAKEAGSRLRTISESAEDALTASVQTMIDALLERLEQAQDEVEVTPVEEVRVPENMTPEYVLWPIVPVSRPGMVVAPSMSGKSSFALMAAYAVATGKPFLDRLEARDPGPVLYIGQEETKEMFASRATMLARGHQIPIPKHLYYLKLRGGSLIDSAELLAEKAATYKAKLIIIDSAQATWGSQGSDNVRDYASRWYNAVEQLAVAVLVIEHPNAEDTRKPVAQLAAAGTSVKRDRVGHQWTLKSIGIPPAPGQPFRYHTTLIDTKRNYISQQDPIYYETQFYRYEWMRFIEAADLSAATIIDSPGRVDMALSVPMRDPTDPGADDEGAWKVSDIRDRLGRRDDKSIRTSLTDPRWRRADWNIDLQYRFERVEGSGTNHITNPERWRLVTRRVDEFEDQAEPVQLSMSPGAERVVN